MVYCACKHIIQSLLLLVQFWTPSPVTQRWGEKGPGSFLCACSRQTNRNAHYVNMFVSPRNTKTGTKIIPSRFKEKCRRTKLRRRKKHVKPGLENCKVCGITTLKNARAVISNPAGKTNLGKNFQAYCKYGIVFRKDSPVLFTRYLRSFRHIAKLGVHVHSSC